MARSMTRAGGEVPAISMALVASSPLLVLLVVAPASIYLGNQQYFDYQYAIVMHLAAVHLAAVLGLYLVFRIVPALSTTLGYALALFGAFLFAVFLLSPSPVDDLPIGGIGAFSISPWWLLLELAIVVVLLGLVRFFSAATLVGPAAAFCGCLAIAIPALVALEALRVPGEIRQWDAQRPDRGATRTSVPNVYHIVLDGFDGVLFQRLVDAYGMHSQFQGFVFYSDAYSNYTSTALSFPSFMTGRLFDRTMTDERGAKVARSMGLINTMVERGSLVSQYNAYHINNHALTHQRLAASTIEMELYGKLRYVSQILDLAVLLSAPSLVKPLTVEDRRGVFTQWLVSRGHTLADWSRNRPLISLKLLLALLEDESTRTGRGNFVSAHLLLPHDPVALNASCEYESARTGARAEYIEQSVCALRLLGKVNDALRALGRFRDSLIVFHSDHGTLQRDRPMLLVKYPGSDREPLEVANHPVQLLDIAPTILGELGIEHSHLAGVPLPVDAPDARPEIAVWIARPSLR